VQHSPYINAIIGWLIKHKMIAEAVNWPDSNTSTFNLGKIAELTDFAVRGEEPERLLCRIQEPQCRTEIIARNMISEFDQIAPDLRFARDAEAHPNAPFARTT
jgi:hypothetical protein